MSIDENTTSTLLQTADRTSARRIVSDEFLPPRHFGWDYCAQIIRTSAPLVLSDMLAFALAIAFGEMMTRYFLESVLIWRYTLMQVLPVMTLFALLFFGLYPAAGMNKVLEFRQTTLATSFVFVVIGVASLRHYEDGFNVLLGLCFVLAALIPLLPMARELTRRIFARHAWWGIPTLIVGGKENTRKLKERLIEQPWVGLKLAGIVLDNEDYWSDDHDSWVLGPVSSLAEIADRHRVYRAIVRRDRSQSSEELLAFVSRHAGTFSPLIIASDELSEFPTLWSESGEMAGMPSTCIRDRLQLPAPRFVKRLTDVLIVLLGSVVALPVILALALLGKVTSRGPIFYRQPRPGRDGKYIHVWKFRTMRENAEEALATYLQEHPEMRHEWETNTKLRNDPRVTRIGRWLRRSSLDELPQLWNVLKGEMSLVGPRPLLDLDIDKYRENYDLYCRVKPGLTGLWQVSGRNNTTYEERVQYDTYYVRNWSPWLDFYILARTFKTVIFGEGAF